MLIVFFAIEDDNPRSGSSLLIMGSLFVVANFVLIFLYLRRMFLQSREEAEVDRERTRETGKDKTKAEILTDKVIKNSQSRGEEEIYIEITREAGEGQTKVKILTERIIKRKDVPALIKSGLKIRESGEDDIKIKMTTPADKTTEKPEVEVKKIKRKDLKEFVEKFYRDKKGKIEVPRRKNLKYTEVITEVKDAEGNIKTEKTMEMIEENEIPNLQKVKGITNVVVRW